MPFGINPVTGRPGPAPDAARDGDKKQARQRINVEVKNGIRQHPNAIPCQDCGHVWAHGERRHEYDHYMGYAAKHHGDVQSVCTRCHKARDSAKAKQTHCLRGHEFTQNNTGRKTNGTRFCRECHHLYDRGRRDATYWRDYRLRKATANA